MDTITTIQNLLTCNGSAQPVMVALTPNECRLIAAAPDLLEALQLSVHLFETYVLLAQPTLDEIGAGAWVNKARAALAKATGEQP